MAVVILKDTGAPRGPQVTASGLHIVSHRRIAFRCRVCGAVFYEGEDRQYVGHVTGCAQRNEAEIRELDLGEQMPGLFGTGAGDVEKKDWYRERKGWRI